MRIAFLTSVVPDGRPTTGYEIANEAIVGGLQALGHAVCCIGFQLPRQGMSSSDAVVLHRGNLENAGAGRWEKVRFIARAFRTGLPVSASKLGVVSQGDCMDAFDAAGPFDAVIANSYQMAAAFPALLAGRRFGYVAHNVEHLSAQENAARARSPLQRMLYARDARLLRTIESRLVANASWTWTLSVEDGEALGVRSPDVAMLPLAVPQAEAIPRPTAPQFDAGLIGTWTWQPNRAGLDWFLDEVVPLLDDGTTVAVAGALPKGMNVPDNVKLLGRVESARDFLASVRAVPLISRGGTGVQLKTIEALQSGLACVATSSAMRGVSNVPDHCRVFDDPAAFAAGLMGTIAASRNGTLPPGADSARAFETIQRNAMEVALDRGLQAIVRTPTVGR